jgi:hypothetical protein
LAYFKRYAKKNGYLNFKLGEQMKIIFKILVLTVFITVNGFAINPCNCKGYAGPGGPCYDGPGGPCYDGPGGPCYSGPGGNGYGCPSVCR